MTFRLGNLRPQFLLSAVRSQAGSGRRWALLASCLALGACLLAPLQTTAQSVPGTAAAPADESFHYDNLWELSGGLSYAGIPSGVNIQNRAQLAGLDIAATQWIYPRLGVTADLRTHMGLGDSNVNPYTVNSPLFIESFGSVGPEYRWIRTPAFGVSLHALAGGGYGIFNLHVPAGVTNSQIGVYNNGSTFDILAGGNFDFNTPSGFGVRVSPNLLTTHFDGNLRNSFSITAGLVWRYGKF